MIIDTALSAHYTPDDGRCGDNHSEFLCVALKHMYPNNPQQVQRVRDMISEVTQPWGTLNNHFINNLELPRPTTDQRMDFWLSLAAKWEQEGQ
jgi:hypothetical protein